ncbi:MAG: hypothetical protein ABI690_05185 [Chloroflexota bacterium]
MRIIRASCFIVICMLLSLSVAAQDNVSPLLDMLKLVPDNEQTHAGVPLVSYADYRAIEAARGIDAPLTKADFDNNTDKASLWIAATSGVMSGMPLNYFVQYLDGMQTAVGFSWFDVDRALTFGQPPSTGNILSLSGGFKAEVAVNTFEARNYTIENRDDVRVLCGPSGCDKGLELNLENRNPSNPFGGELGRDEPVALLPNNVIANSADYAVLSAILDARQGKEPSLADNPAVQAAVNVIAGEGTLRQVQFFNGADVGNYGDIVATDVPESDQPDYLPTYSLAFFADTYNADNQSAVVGLVYEDADSANIATALLVDRLQMAQSMVTNQPFMGMIEDRGGNIASAAVETDAATGKFIALLGIQYPMPPNEKQDGKFMASSLVFKLLIDSIYRRDAIWLAADFTAPQ